MRRTHFCTSHSLLHADTGMCVPLPYARPQAPIATKEQKWQSGGRVAGRTGGRSRNGQYRTLSGAEAPALTKRK